MIDLTAKEAHDIAREQVVYWINAGVTPDAAMRALGLPVAFGAADWPLVLMAVSITWRILKIERNRRLMAATPRQARLVFS